MKQSKKNKIKKYKNCLLDQIQNDNINWLQNIEPFIIIDNKEVYLSELICILRELGVDINIPSTWCSCSSPWREIGAEIIRCIDSYLDFTKKLLYKIIPLYLPIIISIISLVISLIKSGN